MWSAGFGVDSAAVNVSTTVAPRSNHIPAASADKPSAIATPPLLDRLYTYRITVSSTTFLYYCYINFAWTC